jgi:hypothetical protein
MKKAALNKGIPFTCKLDLDLKKNEQIAALGYSFLWS